MSDAAKLDDEYDACLIGATIGLHGTDRFAYSLRRLVEAEMLKTGKSASDCRVSIANQIRDLQRTSGPDGSPVFINDELAYGEAQDNTPKLVLPGDVDFRKPSIN